MHYVDHDDVIDHMYCTEPGNLFKETKSATMNLFLKIFFSFKIICKSRIKLSFHNKSVHYSWKLHGNVNNLIKQVYFLLLVIISVPPIIIDNQVLT